MNADTIALVLVVLMVVPANLFVGLYAVRPWWRSLIGRALMTHSVGLAALIDITLLYKVFGDDYAARDVVRISVYLLILLGLSSQCWALIRTSRKRGGA